MDINDVPGSGPGGRVSVEDVKSYARRLHTSQDERAASVCALPTVSLPDMTQWGAAERRAMSNVRRRTAEHLAQAWATIPHVTQFDRADITDLEQLRQQFAGKAEAAGGKLTITAIIMKVLATALKKFPQFNASVDMTNHEVVYKQYYHIGVAVDTDRGLLVPVHPPCGSEKYCRAVRGTDGTGGTRPHQKNHRGRDARRDVYGDQSGRHWRQLFFSDHQCPRGGDSGCGPEQHGTGV